ncbi:MAG: chlorophyll synthesis pathway protein BchC, partial [Vallitaleaceae bacterium]|nr:chlorophyll synthesis pathway protein BchC [Vallitaleaceae bacterium]
MKVMVYEGPRMVTLDIVEDMQLKENEVRIQTLYTGISHGTEMSVYRGIAPFFERTKDGHYGIFRPAEEKE